MRELVLPKFNNNDDTCILIAWLFEDGDTVAADEVVAEVETSKAVEEMVLDQSAVLHRLVPEKAECPFGTTVAWLFDTAQEREEYLRARSSEAAEPAGPGAARQQATEELVLTKAARELADRHGVGEERLRSLGKKVIKTGDVEGLLARPEDTGELAGTVVELTRRQRAIGAVVTESHRTVPAAFAAARVSLTAFEEYRVRCGAADAEPAGLVELLVKAMAAQRPALPMLFAHLRDERTAVVADEVAVGVTIDVGKGLFIPVLRGVGARPVDELADQLMDFRVKALRQSFREEEFEGADITLSLHNDPGIVLARPIVYPGQSAVVTLCGTEHEVFLDGSGAVSARPCVTIGLSYDHRVVNGREAVLFLRGIKHWLEDAASYASAEARAEG